MTLLNENQIEVVKALRDNMYGQNYALTNLYVTGQKRLKPEITFEQLEVLLKVTSEVLRGLNWLCGEDMEAEEDQVEQEPRGMSLLGEEYHPLPGELAFPMTPEMEEWLNQQGARR